MKKQIFIKQKQKKSSAIYIDRERMDEALKSPTYTIPPNLTAEEIIQFILSKAKNDSQTLN